MGGMQVSLLDPAECLMVRRVLLGLTPPSEGLIGATRNP
jgi:hypothetical protein